MPIRTYMVVDPRHDHGFRRPDPLQSAAVGSPDVCTGCHAKRDAGWAAAAIAKWRRPGARAAPDFARALQAARSRSAAAPHELHRVVADASQPGIVRATALTGLQPWTSPATRPALRAALADPDPLVRAAGAELLNALPPAVRAAEGAAALRDPVRSVRFAALSAIASVGREAWPSPEPAGFRTALEEYRAWLQQDQDRPEGLVGLGMLAAWEGDPATAEIHLRSALERQPDSLLAALNLADVLRARGFEPDAETVLKQALDRDPRSAELQHSLGLLYARTGRRAEALATLGRAAELAPQNPRYAYVYGVALHDLESPAKGIAVLERAWRRAPGDIAILEALAAWAVQRGDDAAAARYRAALGAMMSAPGAPVSARP
jgi:tetratricopeptide (TPR) repeat protein